MTRGLDSAQKWIRLNKNQVDWKRVIFEQTTQRVPTWKQVNRRVRNRDSVMSEKTIMEGVPRFDTYENNVEKRDPSACLWALVGYQFPCHRSIMSQEPPNRKKILKPWKVPNCLTLYMAEVCMKTKKWGLHETLYQWDDGDIPTLKSHMPFLLREPRRWRERTSLKPGTNWIATFISKWRPGSHGTILVVTAKIKNQNEPRSIPKDIRIKISLQEGCWSAENSHTRLISIQPRKG